MRSFRRAAAMAAETVDAAARWNYVARGNFMPFDGSEDDAYRLLRLEKDWNSEYFKQPGHPSWSEFLQLVLTLMHEEAGDTPDKT